MGGGTGFLSRKKSPRFDRVPFGFFGRARTLLGFGEEGDDRGTHTSATEREKRAAVGLLLGHDLLRAR